MLLSCLLSRAIVTQLVECNLAKVEAKGSNPFICLYLIFLDRWPSGLRR